jgi:tetratricopeptide (TPR) repeat protein
MADRSPPMRTPRSGRLFVLTGLLRLARRGSRVGLGLALAAPLGGALACASSAGPSTIAPAAPAAPTTLPFIEDDYARAVAEARASHRLLFVDAWAPWCHTCLSMKAYTFRDPKVRARAGDLVWAAIDTEKPGNADWVASHPMHSWPTLFVVDAESGKTVLEWPNSATPDELVRLLDVAEASRHHEGVLAKAEERAFDGNAAAAAGKPEDAITAWRDALSVAPAGWPGRAATLESLLDRLLASKNDAACAETADRELPKVPRGGARAATLAVMCVTAMPAGDARRPLLDRALDRVRAMAVDENEPMLPDDRSGLYEVLVDALAADGRDADAKTAAGQWATFLEGAAQGAPDAASRAVFDAHRVDAYLAIGAPERAVPMLEASARDFPADYNPPARLARAYLALKRYDDALVAIDRALGLVYGPRALRLYSTKADVLVARGGSGDRARAAATLKEGVAHVTTAPSALPPRYAPLAEQLLQRAHTLEAAH